MLSINGKIKTDNINTLNAKQLSPGVRYQLDLDLHSKYHTTWQQEVEMFSELLIEAYELSKDDAELYAQWILEASTYAENISTIKIAAMIRTESSFNRFAVSSTGAIGPMQVQPKFWESQCGDLKDPRDNILCGTFIVSDNIERYCRNEKNTEKKWECALAHYNIGRGNLIRKKREFEGAKVRYIQKNSKYTKQLTTALLSTK